MHYTDCASCSSIIHLVPTLLCHTLNYYGSLWITVFCGLALQFKGWQVPINAVGTTSQVQTYAVGFWLAWPVVVNKSKHSTLKAKHKSKYSKTASPSPTT